MYYRHLTLGELIYKLENVPRDMQLRFDFADARPTTLDSWRGIYAELAIEFDFITPTTVAFFLKEAKLAVNSEFTGYKGGSYKMTEKTRLWVANYGEVGSTCVADVVKNDMEVVIVTAYKEEVL